MMESVGIQRDEVTVSRDVGDLSTGGEVGRVKRGVSRMQSSRQKESEV